MRGGFSLRPIPLSLFFVFLIALAYLVIYTTIDKKRFDTKVRHYISKNFPESKFVMGQSNYFLTNKLRYQIKDFHLKTKENYTISIPFIDLRLPLTGIIGGRRAKINIDNGVIEFDRLRDLLRIFETKDAFLNLKVHKILRNNEISLEVKNLKIFIKETGNDYNFDRIYFRNLNQEGFTAGEVIFSPKHISNGKIKFNGEVKLKDLVKNKPSLDGILSFSDFSGFNSFLNNQKVTVKKSENSKNLFLGKVESRNFKGDFFFGFNQGEIQMSKINLKANPEIFPVGLLKKTTSDCKEKYVDLAGRVRYQIKNKKSLPLIKVSNDCLLINIRDTREGVSWHLRKENLEVLSVSETFNPDDISKTEILPKGEFKKQKIYEDQIENKILNYIISGELIKVLDSRSKRVYYFKNGSFLKNAAPNRYESLRIEYNKETEAIELLENEGWENVEV